VYSYTFSHCCARDILQEPPLTFGIMRKDRDNIINKYGWWNKIKKNAEGLLDYLFNYLSLSLLCMSRALTTAAKVKNVSRKILVLFVLRF
jgi:hypothetical protein